MLIRVSMWIFEFQCGYSSFNVNIRINLQGSPFNENPRFNVNIRLNPQGSPFNENRLFLKQPMLIRVLIRIFEFECGYSSFNVNIRLAIQGSPFNEIAFKKTNQCLFEFQWGYSIRPPGWLIQCESSIFKKINAYSISMLIFN